LQLFYGSFAARLRLIAAHLRLIYGSSEAAQNARISGQVRKSGLFANGSQSARFRLTAALRLIAAQTAYELAKADGSYFKILSSLAKKDLIVIDDFALAPLTDEQRRDLLEIVEDRYNRKSTLIVSQVPVDHWHEIIGDPTIADAILDRLIHNAHRLCLKAKISKRKESHGDIEF
jgi:hypothetical protein